MCPLTQPFILTSSYRSPLLFLSFHLPYSMFLITPLLPLSLHTSRVAFSPSSRLSPVTSFLYSLSSSPCHHLPSLPATSFHSITPYISFSRHSFPSPSDTAPAPSLHHSHSLPHCSIIIPFVATYITHRHSFITASCTSFSLPIINVSPLLILSFTPSSAIFDVAPFLFLLFI